MFSFIKKIFGKTTPQEEVVLTDKVEISPPIVTQTIEIPKEESNPEIKLELETKVDITPSVVETVVDSSKVEETISVMVEQPITSSAPIEELKASKPAKSKKPRKSSSKKNKT